MWDWPAWTGPGAGALLGIGLAVRVDDRTVGALGGLAVFALFTASDLAARRSSARAADRIETAQPEEADSDPDLR